MFVSFEPLGLPMAGHSLYMTILGAECDALRVLQRHADL
jgi:hypothetical protein